ncbi:hypothetical protein, variant 3 [Aphanomyces astaci]|uniref:Ion transport domain-containing protein n=1 Tax=Aphanomyces astaci TaxID=112090 RepID=W4H6W6_APHAT|nr:hypothetical protein, variant 3 [Aphanomyces astaci]ETV87321.1 hypothetical protein, variant 3 [Aphanomyces astaci]|eukprot:XP_009822183.1 hypothetical protein, variant 3 [Aphanomyces astaci]
MATPSPAKVGSHPRGASQSRRNSRRDSMALADVMNNLPPEVLATLEADVLNDKASTPHFHMTASQRDLSEAQKIRQGGWRRQLRKLFKQPRTSRGGRVYHYTMLGAIVGNFLPMILETLDGPANGGSDPTYPFLPYRSTYFAWEVMFTSLFGLDLLVKVMIAKRQRKFWSRINSWIDVLGILPLLLSLFMQYQMGWSEDRRTHIERYMKLLRLFRIFRVAYMLREVDGIQVLRTTIVECIPPLQITAFFLITLVMMFATVLYYAEPCYNYTKCQFTDIFNAGYFVMVSVATVGYGDQVPDLDNPVSVLVTCVLLIFGALYLAMPLAIIGIKYELTWLRYELKVKRTTTSLSKKSTARHPSTMKSPFAQHHAALPSEDIHPSVHAAYTLYLDLVKDVMTLEAIVQTIMNIPPHEALDSHQSRLHAESLVKLNHMCKQVIVLYQKLMLEMRVFQPTRHAGLVPGESPNDRFRSRSSSITSIASDVIHRAKRVIQQKITRPMYDRQNSTLNGVRLPIRKRLRLVLEQQTSSHAIWVNWFFYINALLGVFMCYAETTPELQAYGPSTILCRRAMGIYCGQPGRTSVSDAGCFVWRSNDTVTSTKLSFDCDDNDRCFGFGWNFGSESAAMACDRSFALPERICQLRQCKTDHAPLADLTTSWIYPEAYFALVFTVEFALRVYATKRRGRFVRSVGSWLDIGAVIPFYAEMVASMIDNRPALFAIVPTFPTVISVLPILKTLRILKMGKHFKANAVLARTAALTYQRLLIPLIFLFLGCVAAGAIFYEVERGTQCFAHLPCLWWQLDIMTDDISALFPPHKRVQVQMDKVTIVTDMWRSTWLSIVTFTTVGYGDLKPRTPVGRLFDILATVFGSCYTAMPLSLIGGQFYYCYEQYFKQQQRGGVPDAPRLALETTPSSRNMSVLSIEDMDILKKCGVVVLLLDEMMQNVIKLNQASSCDVADGGDPTDLQTPQHATPTIETVKRTSSRGHVHRQPHLETYVHWTSDVFNQRISSSSFLGRGLNRVCPVNLGVDDDHMTDIRRRRELIQTAVRHLTVRRM